jgi:hypothetical protein
LFVNELYRRLWSTCLESECRGHSSRQRDSQDEEEEEGVAIDIHTGAASNRVLPAERFLFGATQVSAAERRVAALPLWRCVVQGQVSENDWVDLLIDLFYIHKALSEHVEKNFMHPLWGPLFRKFEPALARAVRMGDVLADVCGGKGWQDDVWPTSSCVRLIERFAELCDDKVDLLCLHWLVAHLSLLLASPYLEALVSGHHSNGRAEGGEMGKGGPNSPRLAAFRYPGMRKLSAFKSKKSFAKVLLTAVDDMQHYIDEGGRLHSWLQEAELGLELWHGVFAEIDVDTGAPGDEEVLGECLGIYTKTRTGLIPFQARRLHSDVKTPAPQARLGENQQRRGEEKGASNNPNSLSNSNSTAVGTKERARATVSSLFGRQSPYKRRTVNYQTLDELEAAQLREDQEVDAYATRMRARRSGFQRRSGWFMWFVMLTAVTFLAATLFLVLKASARKARPHFVVMSDADQEM